MASHTGGIFGESYASCGRVSNVIPVDVAVPGCPPSPREILQGILTAVSDHGHHRRPGRHFRRTVADGAVVSQPEPNVAIRGGVDFAHVIFRQAVALIEHDERGAVRAKDTLVGGDPCVAIRVLRDIAAGDTAEAARAGCPRHEFVVFQSHHPGAPAHGE